MFDQNIEAKWLFENEAFVFNLDDPLVDRSHLAQAQFAHEAFLINAFDQARPLKTMDLNSRPDGRVAELIGFLESWMHNEILQKQTKETKSQ